MKRIMKSAPVLVLRMDWSRKLLKAWASGSSAEPVVAVETAQLAGMVGSEGVSLVELELVVELIVVV